MRGSACAIASSAPVSGRSDSYRTSMRSSAAVAISSLPAATPATGSPTNRTLSIARACSSWLTGRMPNGIGKSLPVSTAFTPGSARAVDVSMAVMRAWGCGLRSSLAYNMRGRNRSSANRVAPVTLAVASTLRIAFPITRKLATGGFLRVPQQGPSPRRGLPPPQPGPPPLPPLVDLQEYRGEAQVFAQHFEQRLVRREGHFDRLAVELERELHLSVGHEWKVILITARSEASFRARKGGTMQGWKLGMSAVVLCIVPSFHLSA